MKNIYIILIHVMSLKVCAQSIVEWSMSVGGNGHKYEFVSASGISWAEANEIASNKGGHLATITSLEEHNFIKENKLTSYFWIGGYKESTSSGPLDGWRWVTGEPFVYQKWHAGEPNDINGNEDYLEFDSVDGSWNDNSVGRSGSFGYVVEYSKTNNLANGLVAHYPFDTDALDVSGLENHGQLKNNPVFVPGVKGGAILLESNGDEGVPGSYVILPMLNFNEYESFSISVWIKESSLAGLDGEGYIWYGDHINGWLGIGRIETRSGSNDSKLSFAVGSTFGGILPLTAEWTDEDEDRFVHYVLVYNDGKVYGYKDGLLVGFKAQNVKIVGENAGVGIHWAGAGDWFSTRLTGCIDDLRIYSRNLSSTEIQKLFNLREPTMQPQPGYEYDGERGPLAILNPTINENGRISFVTAVTQTGGQNIVSWTPDLRRWFPLIDFKSTSQGTIISDNITTKQASYRVVSLPKDVLIADRFDYPIGDRGNNLDGTPKPEGVREKITDVSFDSDANLETNDMYNFVSDKSNPVDNPKRESASTDWHNGQDVGAYYDVAGGIHPGEDWNYNIGESDVGLPVYAVANGVIKDISQVNNSSLTGAGFSIVIRHTLLNGDQYDSVYVHVAPPKKTDGASNERISADEPNGVLESDGLNVFPVKVNDPVYRGDVIAVIANIDGAGDHLHLEIRNKPISGLPTQSNSINVYWPSDKGNVYYGNESSGNTMLKEDVKKAYDLMRKDGIIDPSDFIDSMR